MLAYLAYFCERRIKTEFLQLKENEQMKDELRHILEVVPEAILIYNPIRKQIVMMNTELQRIIKKYSSGN